MSGDTRMRRREGPPPRGEGGEAQAAQTVYRRRGTGERFDPVEEKRRRDEARKPTEEQVALKQGEVQRKLQSREADEMIRLANEGFARSPDDAHLNDELRQIERWDDPMRKFLDNPDEDGFGDLVAEPKRKLSKTEKRARDERLVADMLKKQKTYEGVANRNRFNIPPGPEWDGKDRSNGYEASLFSQDDERREALEASRQDDDL